ncbi:hypothetical protein F5148DRAFT_977142, partial [Russula earlei]
LTTLITCALSDVTPRHNLRDVLFSVQNDDIQGDLDALSLLPLLFSCPQDGTDELLALIARHCNAKEVIMGTQEVIERLSAGSGEEESDVDDSFFYLAIPRLVLRKTPSRTLSPLAELKPLLSRATKNATVVDGRSLVRCAVAIVQEVGAWVREKTGDDLAELSASHAIMESFLNATIEACADVVHSRIAQRVFEARFPRLSSHRPDASGSLGCGLETLQSKPSLASLVLIAHVPTAEHLALPVLVSLFPHILTCLQSNVALDSTLAVLLKVLAPLPEAELSPDLVIPLMAVLPPLCSAHPDATTRLIMFRILGHVLQLTPSVLRLQILRDLVSPSEGGSPYIRTAAIGLVKDAVLEALSDPNTASVFASPFLLQTMGSCAFRVDSPDLLISIGGVDERKDSPELARLVECLNLYYILLLRDVDNRTGIRDPGTVRSIESSLLGPIRSALGKWDSGGLPHLHA